MNKILHGRCLCGFVRYEYIGEIGNAIYCHCDDCRRTTGSPYTLGVQVQATELNIITGQVKGYTTIGESGKNITREFCPKCGSPLFTKGEKWPDYIYLKAGCIDEPELVKPGCQIWTKCSVPWAHIDDKLPSFPGD
jgi:hypothetical protein